MVVIEGGSGLAYFARITPSNRLKTTALNVSETIDATDKGDSYNVNTGDISGITSQNSAIIYLKNNDNRDMFIEAVALGVGPTAADPADGGANVRFTLLKNASTGTLISDANTSGLMIENRNFGSSKTLTATVYKASGDAKTLTDGTSVNEYFLSPGNRVYSDVFYTVPKNQTISVIVSPQGVNMTCYAAFVIYYPNIDNF